ncbi:bifunctional RecB family nuclease/DEAD/DEAH box helicase [Georgenia sp. SYP-B2076]|uniref:TM0106 family RecB-like putative nuclease n=1 Tax=Georgenia sp. SYP-B2076 TaxID=2495881 RepID=UPI000F8D0947|nr:bifunctional RecB family nuclease/DEAD/DEAH box helicase [Georgenia sp. SYP-B2076]
MFLLDDVVVLSAGDVTLGSSCELAVLHQLDQRLGRAEPAPTTVDAMAARVAELGQAHERRVLEGLRRSHGPGGVLELVPPAYERAALEAHHARTLEALRAGVDVVYQGSFFDGRFHGRADFLVREHASRYAVHDSKLARHAKIPALLQLAAYADQLARAGIPVSAEGRLLLGDGSISGHDLTDIVALYRERRARLEALVDGHAAQPDAARWGDDRYRACGRCPTCARAAEAHRDVLLVANLRLSQRAKLRAAGITTVEELAASTGPVDAMARSTLESLRHQARLQSAQDRAGPGPDGRPLVRAEVVDAAAIASLPAPDPGDVYFDFEGDPLWARGGSDWGLEYLFGLVEADTGEFRTYWAHDRAAEKHALEGFLEYLRDRRRAHPGMHVYHYAPYEKTALRRLVGRHGVGEEELDELLRDGVLVDLYATVRQGIRVSQPSYSLKKLEPLYMAEARSDQLDNAADSVAMYAVACDLADAGDADGAAATLAAIAEYNHYDCRSTRALHRWLLETLSAQRAAAGSAGDAGHGGGGGPGADAGEAAGRGADGGAEDGDDAPRTSDADPDAELRAALLARAGDGPAEARTADEQAFAMVAAALGYSRRERKPFWWEHFDRLSTPLEDWGEQRDTLIPDAVAVERDWFKEGRQRSLRRRLRLTGTMATGSTTGEGTAVFLHYDPLFPGGLTPPAGGIRAGHQRAVVREHADRSLLVEERLASDAAPYPDLPVALSPGPPPATASQEAAVRALAGDVAAAGLFPHPGLDLARRLPPRVAGGALPPVPAAEDGPVTAITAAVRALDRSYLAVQGPPGTGKTYVGARVIARLVADGWRVGVVAQSHAVVEHLLDTVVEAGVPADRVGKKDADARPHPWSVVPDSAYAAFLDRHRTHGCVLGGTAWDFTNTGRVPRGLLDLLVVDEAGQFCLATTLAVSLAAQRLLLLGDPQQLPQVSQGAHPEPVDGSALGWVAGGHGALPAEHGYFLERTWRMHPALTAPVSRLSYEGRLSSQERVTARRSLEGVEPGIHVVVLDHRGNATVSPEESAEVVRRIRGLVGRAWSDGVAPPRPLGPGDVLVVAAYNAQVASIRAHLDAAGLGEARVGTVDKLQGQEAPVVIVSMAASTPEDVPRGMGFLLSRNRINVAVSRGQWAAILIRSRQLTDYLPPTPEALAELGAFIRLCDDGRREPPGRSPRRHAQGIGEPGPAMSPPG